MAVQDDRREKEMCQFLGLREGDGRSGVDAFLDFSWHEKMITVPLELKSTTNYSVSTARDVGPAHIEKWRACVWIFGFYDVAGRQLQKLLTLGPNDMEGWIGKVERYIAPDFAIGKRIAAKLTLEDLHIICGEKKIYSMNDAQVLHKRQWKRADYLREMDLHAGYSPLKMLEILRLRAVYLTERGSTLNNPHIPSSFFSNFSQRMHEIIPNNANLVSSIIQQEIRDITIANAELGR